MREQISWENEPGPDVRMIFRVARAMKGWRSNLVGELSQVYPQNLMGIKLLTALLVLTLFGASSGPMVICAVNCMPSADGSVAVHHHQMKPETGLTSNNHVQAHQHGSACAQCPPESRNSFDQKFDCSGLIQIEALRNGTFSLDEPSGVAHFGVSETPAYIAGLASDGEWFSVFGSSRQIRSLGFASVPLRI